MRFFNVFEEDTDEETLQRQKKFKEDLKMQGSRKRLKLTQEDESMIFGAS